MAYIIAGLGNPGQEYDGTRHNTGRIVLDHIRQEWSKGEFELDKKLGALTAEAKVGKEKVLLVAPETFMNRSGKALAPLIKSAKAAERLIVIYDDFSLPLGRIRVSYNRSSGGHNGLESIIKALKTEAFVRIRIGTAAATAKGSAKLMHGDDKIEKFILGPFKPDELKALKKISAAAAEAARLVITESREKAMSIANAS